MKNFNCKILPGYYEYVFWLIISDVAVVPLDNFIWPKPAAKLLLRNDAVLVPAAPFNIAEFPLGSSSALKIGALRPRYNSFC